MAPLYFQEAVILAWKVQEFQVLFDKRVKDI